MPVRFHSSAFTAFSGPVRADGLPGTPARKSGRFFRAGHHPPPKTLTTMNTQHKLLALALAVAACVFAGGSLAGAPDTENKNNSTGFFDRLKSWQRDMSKTFQETFEKMRKDSAAGGPYIGTASVDLREQKEHYTLRLNLPGRTLDKVTFTLDSDTLHVEAPAEGTLGRYKQSLALSGASRGAEPAIERKQNESLIVVTVPKSGTPQEPRPGSGVIDTPFLPLLEWDRDVFSRMERMQTEMDRVFEEGFKEFRLLPEHRGFFDRPRFGSSVDLKEEGDDYVIRAYLPGRNMNNVNVTVDDRTLKIEAHAEEKKEEKSRGSVIGQKSHYSQLLTLPGPVQADKMKVDRKEGMLVVTVPKAKSD